MLDCNSVKNIKDFTTVKSTEKSYAVFRLERATEVCYWR